MLLSVLCLCIFSTLSLAVPVTEPLHAVPLTKVPHLRRREAPSEAFQRHQSRALERLHKAAGSDGPDPSDLVARAESWKRTHDSLRLGERMWFPPKEGDQAETPSTPRVLVNVDPASATQRVAVAQPTTTVVASGSNANGFSMEAVDASNEARLTNSTDPALGNAEPYIIEFNDIGYLVEIEIGTPPRTFLMLADTGSGDTWAPSTECTECGDHPGVGLDVSNTFKATEQEFSITYGSGSASGFVCSDRMSIAGMDLEEHPFGAATQTSVQFSAENIPFAGLIGLSFSSLSTQRVLTPIDAMKRDGLIRQSILGIALGRITDGENNGELVFGSANPAKLDASTTQTLPVTSQVGFWQVAMAEVTVNGEVTASGRQAILDTGTSLMIAPEADATAFHRQIVGARSIGSGMFSIPCTTDAVVALIFGGAAFQIDVRDLLFAPLTNNLAGQCISTLSAGTVVDDQTWLLGDSFLKNVYMTTNVEDRTVQLSARTDVPGSSSFGVVNAAAVGNTAGAGVNSTNTGGTSNRAIASAAGRSINCPPALVWLSVTLLLFASGL